MAPEDAPHAALLLRTGEQRTLTDVTELAARWPGARFTTTDDEFVSRLLRLQFTDLRLETSSGSAYVCERDEDLIRRDPQHTIALDLVLTGAIWRQHADSREVQVEGEVCLTVVDEPFSYGWIRPGRSVRTVSDIELLPAHLRSAKRLLPGVLPMTPLVISYVGFIAGLLTAATPDAVHYRQLDHALTGLHRAVILEAIQTRHPAPPSLRVRIEELIETRFTDPTLTPTSIAAALSVSLRAVHQAMEGEHTTLARHIRDRRVRAVAAVLRYDPSPPPLRDLAHRYGFSSADQLRRNFRAVLHTTPHTYRTTEHAATGLD